MFIYIHVSIYILVDEWCVPGEIVGPIHDVEAGKGGREHDPAQHVNLLGARLVLRGPTGQHRPRQGWDTCLRKC